MWRRSKWKTIPSYSSLALSLRSAEIAFWNQSEASCANRYKFQSQSLSYNKTTLTSLLTKTFQKPPWLTIAQLQTISLLHHHHTIFTSTLQVTHQRPLRYKPNPSHLQIKKRWNPTHQFLFVDPKLRAPTQASGPQHPTTRITQLGTVRQ
jgi:hypothetical protein